MNEKNIKNVKKKHFKEENVKILSMKKHVKHAWRHGFGNVKHAKGAW